jgi:hypothetical protein
MIQFFWFFFFNFLNFLNFLNFFLTFIYSLFAPSLSVPSQVKGQSRRGRVVAVEGLIISDNKMHGKSSYLRLGFLALGRKSLARSITKKKKNQRRRGFYVPHELILVHPSFFIFF